MSEPNEWTPGVLARVQDLLDRSAATATPEVGRVFARDDWRFDAPGSTVETPLFETAVRPLVNAPAPARFEF